MKSIRNTITNLLILFTILIISSCNVFNFNGDLKAQTDSVLTVPCSFYETDDIDSRYEDHNFIIGKTVYSTSFPYFTQDDYLLKGWRFYKYRNPTKTGVPETLTYNQKGLIVSMYVEPDPVCLYGVWVKKRYVTFVTNCDTEFNQLVVGDGDSIQETVIFTDQYMNMKKEKHAFRGWYTDPEFNNPYDFNTPVTSDITLYAKWVLQITINYYQNDGTIRVYSDTYDYGQERWISYHRYERPQGKGFVGWATSADATSPSYYLDDVLRDQAEDLDLYAVWSTDTVTITYHKNNGDDTTHIETVGRGAKFRIGHYTKIEQNMTRACWLASLNDLWPTPGKSIRACSANASSSIDAAEYPIINSLETISDSIDLYCIWGDKTYNVHFFIQDPVSKKRKNINNESVSWGSKATAPDENPYLPGYVFVGWCLNVNGQMSDTIFDFNTVLNEENLGTDGDYVEFVSKFEPGSQNQNVFYVSSMTELQKNGTGLYPFATVSEAISAINSINNSSQNYTIVVEDRIYDNINISTLNAASLTIKSGTSYNMSIEASSSYSPIVTVNVSQPITFSKIYFSNGNANIEGGAVDAHSSSNITFNECSFAYNNSNGNGGAIYIENNAYVKLYNCSSYNNSCSGNGGFIYDNGNLVISGTHSLSGWGVKNNDIYLCSGKKIEIASDFTGSANIYITMPASSYVNGTQVLEIPSGVSNAQDSFNLSNSSWQISSNGTLTPAP